eukprot:6264099-Prymnesium_polylepis.2
MAASWTAPVSMTKRKTATASTATHAKSIATVTAEPEALKLFSRSSEESSAPVWSRVHQMKKVTSMRCDAVATMLSHEEEERDEHANDNLLERTRTDERRKAYEQ